MKTFKDTAGRTWTLAVNVDSLKRVRAVADVDLVTVIQGELMGKLIDDPELLVNVVYALCKEEADKQGVSDADFGKAMAGDAIDHATTALMEDLIDFFPRAKRETIRKAVTKHHQIEAEGLKRMNAELDAIDPKAAIAKAFGVSASSSPAAPA